LDRRSNQNLKAARNTDEALWSKNWRGMASAWNDVPTAAEDRCCQSRGQHKANAAASVLSNIL